jgi:hypothetical protein
VRDIALNVVINLEMNDGVVMMMPESLIAFVDEVK